MRNLRMVLCFGNARGRLAVFSLALLVVSISAFWLAPAASAASKAPAFGREVIVDHQRVAGEPSISIDSQDRIYVAAPCGFSTTASFVWRSTDHGRSFHLVPGDLATFGKPTTCTGGGDSAWPSTPGIGSTSATCRARPTSATASARTKGRHGLRPAMPPMQLGWIGLGSRLLAIRKRV